MSAAEKLKALDETFKASKNQREQADYLYRMAAALPQIVTVVEAAQRAALIFPLEATGIQGLAKDELLHALAALNEKLASDR